MAPQTRSGRGQVGKSAAKKTTSSAIGGGKGKVTTSSAVGKGKSAAKQTTSSAIGKGIRKWQTTSNPDNSDEDSSDPCSPVASPDKETVFSQRIGQYVAMRLYNTAKTILPLLSCQNWDSRVVEFILELIQDLKDIELTAPRLQAISALGDCYGRAPQGGAEALIADSINEHVLQWIKDSSAEYEMMRVWAESPTWIIHTALHDRSRLP